MKFFNLAVLIVFVATFGILSEPVNATPETWRDNAVIQINNWFIDVSMVTGVEPVFSELSFAEADGSRIPESSERYGQMYMAKMFRPFLILIVLMNIIYYIGNGTHRTWWNSFLTASRKLRWRTKGEMVVGMRA